MTGAVTRRYRTADGIELVGDDGGGRVAVGLLPDFLAVPLARLEPYGMFIIIGLLFHRQEC